MAASRRGRPYQVPRDSTELRDADIDVDARVGWLLLMSRLHSGHTELALGGQFVAALKQAGLRADRSSVSRWEAGKLPPRLAVLAAYERVLELDSGRLTSIANALRRAYEPSAESTWTPIPDPQSTEYHRRLDELLDALHTPDATGAQWLEFAYYAYAPSLLYLHGDVWRELSRRLLDQLARSVALAHVQRLEATRTLVEHTIAQSWLLQAAAGYLDDPAAQVLTAPVDVLTLSTDPEAARVLLAAFLRPEPPGPRTPVYGLAAKVRAMAFDADDLRRIEDRVVAEMSTSERGVAGVAELVLAMPEAARARLMASARTLPGQDMLATAVAHGEWVQPQTAEVVSGLIADELTERLSSGRLYDEDPMTPRILREALFSAQRDHRHYARLVLLGSPFRDSVAEILTERLAVRSDPPLVAAALAQLLRELAGPAQEPTLLTEISTADDAVATELTLALGGLPATSASLQPLVDRLGTGTSSLDRAVLYALGMRQDAALPELAADTARPPAVRAGAEWWLSRGGAVRV